MSKGYGKTVKAHGGDVGRQPHRQYRFLVTDGYRVWWVHCPMCQSVDENWGPETGKALYSGGFITAEVPDGQVWRRVVVACDFPGCEDGQRKREVLGIVGASELHPSAEIIDPRPVHVLWDCNEHAGARPREGVDTPAAVPEDKLREFSCLMWEQFRRWRTKEINSEQFNANRQHIAKKMLPAKIVEVEV